VGVTLTFVEDFVSLVLDYMYRKFLLICYDLDGTIITARSVMCFAGRTTNAVQGDRT
jgi:hypothetical protein